MAMRRRSSRRPSLGVEGQRQAEIHVDGALVHLVEEHRGDALQRRVVEDHADEDAGGDQLDAGVAGHLRVVADAVAYRAADRLAANFGDARGGGARGQAARLDDDDSSVAAPRGGEQRRRHAGRLAGAGRRDEDGGVAGLQSGKQGREDGFDREHERLIAAAAVR
jgi:hypothetical protein